MSQTKTCQRCGLPFVVIAGRGMCGRCQRRGKKNRVKKCKMPRSRSPRYEAARERQANRIGW